MYLENYYPPRRPILVNSLTLENIDDFPLMNTLIKIFVQPLKSLCFCFTNVKFKISSDNIDYIIKIIKELEKHLKL